MYDERRAYPAQPGVAFPQLERRVACPGPAPRVVVEGPVTAELVEVSQSDVDPFDLSTHTLGSLTVPIRLPSALAPLSDRTRTGIVQDPPRR